MVTAIGLGYGFVILDTAEKYRENGTHAVAITTAFACSLDE